MAKNSNKEKSPLPAAEVEFTHKKTMVDNLVSRDLLTLRLS
jgi:hypothetical protein